MIEVKNAVGVDVEGDGDGHTSTVRPGYRILDHACFLRVDIIASFVHERLALPVGNLDSGSPPRSLLAFALR
jgi:hypothetical protein